MIALAAWLVSLPGLWMGIHADDWFQLRPRLLPEIFATFFGDWNTGRQGVGGFYRPMVRVTFAFDNWLHGGSAPGSHLTNGILFVAVAVGAFMAALFLAGGRVWPAFFATLFLLVLNPVRSEALYWLSGRTDLLAALFVFSSLAFALHAIGRNQLVSAVIAMVLLLGGLLSKESAIAGCAIIPLAAWMLRPRGPIRPITMALILVPPLLAILYLIFRRTYLGGLGGYEAMEPRSIGLFLRHGAMALSGVFWPWRADSEGIYPPMLALPGIIALGLLLLRAGVPRGAAFGLLAMGLSLVPISFIAPTPYDGSRVLVLPLGFLAMTVAGAFGNRMKPLTGIRLVVLGVFLTVTLLPVQWGIWRAFIAAKAPNQHIIEQGTGYLFGAVSVASSLDKPVYLILPEPPRSQPRRILDPGLALLLSTERPWLLYDEENTTRDATDPDSHKFALAYEFPGTRIKVAPHLQPWMEGTILETFFRDPHHLEVTALSRVKGPEEFFPPEDWNGRDPIPVPIGVEPSERLALLAIGEARPHSRPRVEVIGEGVSWWIDGHEVILGRRNFTHFFLDSPRPVRVDAMKLHVESPTGPFRLHSLSLSLYSHEVGPRESLE
ncbi:MAG: hypothetical protein JJU11_03510 [Candidatus Sumerlaeia bacterium]|nr:hypothetical protein [Candidatus Sumerlaeia bacterium]